MILVVCLHDTEVPGLVRWGKRIAYGEGTPLRVLCLPRSSTSGATGDGDAPQLVPDPAGDECEMVAMAHAAAGDIPGVETEIWRGRSDDREETVLAFVEVTSPDILLLGKQTGGEDIALRIFQSTPCTTVLMRLANSDGLECDRILLPTGGGRHSREAVRLGCHLAIRAGAVAVPAFVEPPTDEVSKEVGERRLSDILKKSGVDPKDEHIAPEVVLAKSLGEGITTLAEGTGTDLIMMGDSGAGSLRRALFGTVPDRLLSEDTGIAVAVLRRKTPLTDRLRERLGRFLQLTIPQLAREERIDLFKLFEEHGRWSFDFMVLICLSTLIAAFGLIQNSTAVVIGAMLVAPLMTPLLGAGLALVQHNRPLLLNCAKAIVLGFLCALGIGVAVGFLFGPSHLTPELLGRCAPRLLDLGVAFFSGVAASYCVARPRLSSALAGVAIAAALVPPIATVGICLGMGEFQNGAYAAELFGTNVVAIILGASTNYFVAGIRGQAGDARPWLRTSWGILAAVGVALVAALSIYSAGGAKPARLLAEIEHLCERDGGGDVEVISVSRSGSGVEVELRAPDGEIAEESLREFSAVARGYYAEDTPVRFIITPKTVVELPEED